MLQLQAMENQLHLHCATTREEEKDYYFSAIVSAALYLARHLLIHQSETEFRDLNRRLESLSDTLQSVLSNRSVDSSPAANKLQQQVGELLATVKHEDDDELYVGLSSFHSQSHQVAQYFEDGLEPAKPGVPSGPISSKSSAEATPGSSTPTVPVAKGDFSELAKLPLPPSTLVLSALRCSLGLVTPRQS